MTEKQWDANPDYYKELAEILRKPVVIAALSVITDEGLRPMGLPNGVTLDITQYGAFIGFKREGYFEALKNLQSLSLPPTPKESGLKSWETATPPDAKK